jgi:two-component system cell cycle sensor histidine kinase PleC
MSSDSTLFPRAMSLAVHELRTPVTVVAGYLRMVLREQAGPLNDKQRKMLEEADRSCARIGSLVSEMSELGKLESEQVAIASNTIDLCALLVEVASNMHEGEDRDVRLAVRGADRPVMVAGDRVRLAAALTAFMHAALRERAEPGTIVVQCATFEDGGQPWAVVAIGEEGVTSQLIDSARETLPPFDEWRGGLGLALPIGKRVVEAHGGAIWSASGDRPRAGSALRLPVTRS